MISTLDHLIIAVKDLDQAEKNYKKILGTNPVWRGRHKSIGIISAEVESGQIGGLGQSRCAAILAKGKPKHPWH